MVMIMVWFGLVVVAVGILPEFRSPKVRKPTGKGRE
jgi:hypothetical protein